jgi:feruloyl esterase
VAQAASGRSIHGRPVTVVTPRESCAALADLDLTGIPGAATQIDSATTASASGGWSYCDVTGTIAPQDQFELQLPLSTYTRRYLQVGCGVLCGTLSIVVPGAYSCLPVNDGEFAEASDDEGHTGGGGTFGENPELRADFGYITEHQLALVAKAIISHFYGSDPSYSYYDGCSNGGHEALSEAQRYPRDFNGIIAGASASIVQEANTFYQPWMANVDWTASGQPILTAGQLPLLHDAVMAACAGADGQIDDPLNCHYDPAALLCHGAPAPSCLTAAQVAVVKKIYSGPVDSQGQRLYPGGQPWGSELAWLGWVIPYPGQTYSQTLTYAIGSEWLKFLAFKRVLAGSQTAVLRHALFTAAEFAKAQKLAGLYDADNPDLSAFEADGGRLIMWQGWADEAVSPYGTIDYYTQMTRAMGGLTATQQFARLFMLPGVNHCVGGNAPNQIDAMDAIVNWVEQGPAPASLLATETSTSSPPTVVATRPIYPYPEISQYNGTGSVADASSYSGVPTTALPTTKWLGHFPSARALWCSYGSTGYLCTARRGGG